MPDNRRRPPRGPGAPTSDIDRFLQEVERLRKKSAADRQRVDDVDVVDEVEVVRPNPRSAPPPPPVRQRWRAAFVPEPLPVAAVVPVRSASRVEATPESQAAPAAPRMVTRAGKPVSPLVAQVLVMLRSQQHARSAILLGEILGKPLCKKR